MYPCIVPNFDNTPRSGRDGIVLTDSKPEYFRAHVRDAVASVADRPWQERLVWVKSWNEWAEGNYLEPDLETGRARLEALRDEIDVGARGDSDGGSEATSTRFADSRRTAAR